MMTVQSVKRATVGMSVLGWVALACLTLNGAFWGTLMWGLLAPPALLSAQTLQAALAIVAFALVLPLFWSMLLPSSPAGRLLQKQTWRLPGQLAVTFAAVFLTWMAATWLRLWWGAQPNIADAGQDLFLTITSLIAGILVPALSWCVMTPEQWVAQLEQARNVKRIEHAMQMEETAMRAAYARAVSLLNADLCNLSIAQRQELASILGAFARTQQQALASIAASWNDMYGVECQLTTIPDKKLLASYEKVAGLLAGSADIMQSSADYADEVRSRTVVNDERRMATESQTNANVVEVANESANARIRANSYECANESANDADVLELARRELGTTGWKRQRLIEVTGVKATKASALIKAWAVRGIIVNITGELGVYQFVED
jgi:hypothetical protein